MKPTVVETFWSPSRDSLAAKAFLVISGSALLAVSSKFQVPFYPVPMTLQTLVLLVLSLALGWRLAGLTVVAYLVEGAIGLPVFAGTPEKGMGLAYMLGGTGGYLLGFLFAALLCGALAERGWDRKLWSTAVAMVLANTVIYMPGLIWLGVLFGWDKPILEWGLYPFLLGDLVKVGLGSVGLWVIWKQMPTTWFGGRS